MLAFSIDRDAFLKPLMLVVGVAEKKQNLAILANVLLSVTHEYLQLNATDTEIEIVAKLNLPTPPEMTGVCTISAKKLIDICKSSSNDVLKFSQSDNKITITSGKSKFSLATLPAEGFPKITNDIKIAEFNLNTAVLKMLLNATYFSMAQQDVRYYLNGVLLEFKAGYITAVATDGHRLAVCEHEHNIEIAPFRIILPRKGVLELLKLLEHIDDETIGVSVSNNHFYIDTLFYTFISKLINGTFPNYTSVIPKVNDKEVIIDRNILKKSLMRVAILSNEKYRGLKFAITPGLIKIMATNPEQEQAEEELEAQTSEDGLVIDFNVNYLLDVLNVFPEGPVKLSFSTPEAGVLIESRNAMLYSRYVIMPMKI